MTKFENYQYYYDELHNRIRIEPSNCPSSLGRYFTCDHRKVDSLIAGKIYAPSIEQLNDVFEGSLLKGLVNVLAQKQPAPELARHKNEDNLIKRTGIVSFCADSASQSMWGLYAQHRGVFVEFDRSNFLNSLTHDDPRVSISNFVKVDYLKEGEMQLMGGRYETIDDGLTSMIAGLHRKSDAWISENEFRIIIALRRVNGSHPYKDYLKTPRQHQLSMFDGEISRVIRFDTNSIKSVTLGINFIQPRFQLAFDNLSKKRTIAISDEKDPSIRILNFCIDKKIPVFQMTTNSYQILSQRLNLEADTTEKKIYLSNDGNPILKKTL